VKLQDITIGWEKRLVKYNGQECLFHGFFQKTDSDGAEPVVLVETSDGQVLEVPACQVRFVGDKVCSICAKQAWACECEPENGFKSVLVTAPK
jgi:hypothetical protein